jgi:hypothetical protein
MGELREVTRDEFFARINPLNVHPRPEREATFWELPNRTTIGKTTPGYLCVGRRAYFLALREPSDAAQDGEA